jgi:hypothetical protein
MLMATDTALVQRAALGDADAFASVYEESFRCIYAFAARATSAVTGGDEVARRAPPYPLAEPALAQIGRRERVGILVPA